MVIDDDLFIYYFYDDIKSYGLKLTMKILNVLTKKKDSQCCAFLSVLGTVET